MKILSRSLVTIALVHAGVLLGFSNLPVSAQLPSEFLTPLPEIEIVPRFEPGTIPNVADTESGGTSLYGPEPEILCFDEAQEALNVLVNCVPPQGPSIAPPTRIYELPESLTLEEAEQKVLRELSQPKSKDTRAGSTVQR